MEIPYIKLFLRYEETLEPLSDAEKGRLFMALLKYARTGEVPQLTGNERFLFPTLKQQADRDKEEYEEFLQRQQNNGKKGGAPSGNQNAKKQPTGCFDQRKTIKTTQTTQEEDQDQDQNQDQNQDQKKESAATPHQREGGQVAASSVPQSVKSQQKTSKIFTLFAGNNTDLLNALNDFADMREKSKKPLATDRAKQMLIDNLVKLSPDPATQIAILNQSIFHGWQGVFELKGEGGSQHGVTQGNSPSKWNIQTETGE